MHLAHYLLLTGEGIALALVPVILIQRKEPASTFAWILVLIFLPAVGVALFLLFGRTRIYDHRPPAEAPATSAQSDPSAGEGAHASVADACCRVAEALTHTRATVGDEVGLLIDGDATYAAIGAAIDAARSEVHAEYYLIHDDTIGRWFGERLAAAARRGVRVRLLKDGYGSLALGRAWVAAATAAGVEVRTFLPVRAFVLRPASLRNHRKIVTVDGRVGFVGGINVCAEHSRRETGELSWRDVHLRIEGPSVAQLHAVFRGDWRYATGEDLPEAPPLAAQRAGGDRVAIVPCGPETHTEAIHRVFFTAITRATREVAITSPYFGPDDAILVALETAAMRGVAVSLVVPSASNHRVTFHAGRSLYERLLEAGVRIFEYQPGMIHAKTLVIDRRLALIGSSNMDLRSFRLNYEVHALVEQPSVVAALHASIAQDIAASAPLALDAWRRRPLRLRVIEGGARLLSPLL